MKNCNLSGIEQTIWPMCNQPVETLWVRTFVLYAKFEEVVNETFRLRRCPHNPPITIQWYKDYFNQEGIAGLSLSKVRNEVGWKRMSRYLSDQEKAELDTAHAEGYGQKKTEKKKRTNQANKEIQKETRQQKWTRRIVELQSQGKTFGKIKSQMNVSRKSPEEQVWFDRNGYELYLQAC